MKQQSIPVLNLICKQLDPDNNCGIYGKIHINCNNQLVEYNRGNTLIHSVKNNILSTQSKMFDQSKHTRWRKGRESKSQTDFHL
jgi:hypothetical protein